jgi:hypothetical protein
MLPILDLEVSLDCSENEASRGLCVAGVPNVNGEMGVPGLPVDFCKAPGLVNRWRR